jgi:two-component system, NarL family, sensor kinase
LENTAPIEIPLLIVIATIGIIIFIAFIIFFVLFYQKKAFQTKALAAEKEKEHQRELTNMTMEVAEMERKRTAANLHDDIGGMINLVKTNLSKIAKNSSDPSLKELGEQSSAFLETAMDNIRNISRDLAPPVLLRLGFEEGLAELCTQISKTGAIKIEFQGSKSELNLPKQTELQLYRIINEILNNIIKHASPSKLHIDLINTKTKLGVAIRHDGRGLTNAALPSLTENSKGIGLKSIQSRANIIHAKIDYSINDSGSLVNIEIPL